MKMEVDSNPGDSKKVEFSALSSNAIKCKSTSHISPDQHVVLRLPSEGIKIIELRNNGLISLGKFGCFEVSGILGYPFGQTFEIIEDNKVKPIRSMTDQTVDIPEEEETEQEINKDTLTQLFTNSAENNQNIINIGSKIQKLTSEEIDKIKKSGASSDAGQKIIEQIIAGHGGFDKKTIYSQQKYLKRKQQKFLKRFSVEYLGGSQLLEYSILRDLQKVLDMSEESMALLMTYGNVRPGGNYLLIDETGGVLLYAMMERMQGQGTITIIHENEHPNIIALRYSDYPIELQERMVKTINWLQVVEPANEKIIWEDLPGEEVDSMKSNKKVQYYRRQKRANDINSVIDSVSRGNFDALISVSSLDMTGVLPYLIPKIGGSRPIVLYNQFKEVLLDIQHYLSNDKRVLAPSIYESRVRPYQTIPGRLHPMMTSRGYGGYVLWGTKVIPVEGGLTAVGRGNQLKKKSTPVEDAKVKSEASLDSKASETPEPAKLS